MRPAFSVSPNYARNIYPRYRVVIVGRRWPFFVFAPFFLLWASLLIAYLVSIPYPADNSTQIKYFFVWTVSCVALIIGLFFVYFLFSSFSERHFDRHKLKEKSDRAMKRKSPLLKVDPKICVTDIPIRGRTYYRYCAYFKMIGDEITIEDKVVGLINGRLKLDGVGESLEDGIIRLNLTINNINTMWIARDIVVIRFCWGETFRHVWDVIIDRLNFKKGTDTDFLDYMKDFLECRQIVYDKADFKKFKGQVQLGNESTDIFGPSSLNFGYAIPRQRTVKIYKVNWGPFRKESKNQKGEKNE